MILELVQNVAFLVALAISLQILVRRLEGRPALYGMATGLLFGAVGIAGMMTPMHFAPGLIYDGRTIVLSLAGLFGGPVAALLATMMCGAYRLYLGGAGALVGLGTIIEAAILGTVLHYLRQRDEIWVRPARLWAFALLVHVVMLALQLLIPNRGWDVLQHIGPIVLFFYPLAFLVIAQVFLDGERRRKIENILHASERKYRELVENANSIILRMDHNGNVLFFNLYAQRFFGYSEKEIIGRNIVGTIVPESESSGRDLRAMVQEILRYTDRYAQNENENLRKNGETVWVAWTNKAVSGPDPTFPEILCVGQDITKRKRAEDELRHITQFNQEVILGAAEGIVVYDREFRYLVWNPFMEALAGIPACEALGKCALDMFPHIREQGVDHLLERALAGETVHSHDIPFRNPVTGRSGWIAGSYAPHRNGNRDIIGVIAIIKDVTERKQREEHINLLGRILDDAPASITIHDGDGRFLYANQMTFTLHGYDSAEFMATNLHDLDVPESEALLAERFRRIAEDGQATFEVAHFYKDGTTFPLQVLAKVIEWQGQPAILSIATDITERRRVEQALKASEERYRTVADFTYDWEYWTDPAGHFIYCSPACERITGYRAEEFEKNPDLLIAITHPDDRERIVHHAEGAASLVPELHAQEFRIFTRSGEMRWIAHACRTVRDRDGADRGRRVSNRDTTEWKQAEAERERLALAIQQAAETIVITDAAGTIQYVNPAFEKSTGYTKEEAIGQNPRILKSAKQDDVFYKTMWDTLTRGDTWTSRIVNKKKDGTLYTEDATISPVRDASGNTINYVAVKRDITNEIRLEVQLQQAQKMEAIGQLAGGVAHDFNNLLQVILINLDIMKSTLEPESKYREMLEDVGEAAGRATDLTRQLLAFGRRQIIQPVNVDLNDLLQGVLKMIRRVIGEHIELCFMPGERLGIVYVDKGQIEQILMNLCVNARDAMPTGGTLTIETENVIIDDAYCHEHAWATAGRYVLLSVTDTGYGIDEATRGQIFEPFFTTKGVGEGTGLGLATVYGIVKHHNGLIHVYSELGKGTAFKVYLPIVERRAEEVGSKVENAALGGTETILVAEDEDKVRGLMVRLLESAGYTIFSACDGEEALRVFEEHADTIDMAILDVMMPRLGGREVMDRIQAKCPRMRFLFSSGYSENAIHTNFVIKEGLHLITKPYHRADLLRAVREMLDTPVH